MPLPDASPAFPAAGKWLGGPKDWTIAVLTCLLVAFPLAHSASLGFAGKSAPAAPRSSPEYFVALAARQYQSHQYRECVGSAHQALKLQPDLANAFNNMGACYGALGLLDEAIRNDAEAVRIQPDHQLARNNLAWALEQKRLQSANVKR